MWNQCRPDGCRFCTTWLGSWDDDAAPMLAIQDHATLQTDAAGVVVVTSDIAGWVTLNLLQFLDISVCLRIPDSGCILNHRSNVHFVGWISYALLQDLRLRFGKARVPFAFLVTESMWLLKFNLESMVTPRYLEDSTSSSDGVHAFGYNSAESEPIWMKSGALWIHCLEILGAIRAVARAGEPN